MGSIHKISTDWTKHLRDEEERKRFAEIVKGSSLVLDQLASILEKKLQARVVFGEEDFKNPSWAYEAADRNGYIRALKETIKILRGVDHDDRGS